MIRLWRPTASDGPIALTANPWTQYEIVLRGGYLELAAATASLELASAAGFGVHHALRQWPRWTRHSLPYSTARTVIHADEDTVVLVLRWRRVRPVRTYQ